jgi:S1-C subfamily serine protease/poly(3-hydroxybutyrate) depolymerase
MSRRALFLAALAAAALLAPQARAQTLDQLQEKAIQDAVKKIAPCVVKIETSGGTEVVKAGPKGMIRRGSGPTTGVIVSPDGYVISSAFNFANNPTTIRVVLPGTKARKVARVVATDQTRMLTLLKIVDLPAGTTLPVPEVVPTADRRIGYTAIAIGRTLSLDVEGMPSVSVGIISALERIWGKVLQTDAKVSPTNYGGPLIDLYGRVYGILVPASPQAEGQLAGFEWYDSGIGFAVPLSDINAVLPRLKAGTEANPVVLRRGFLGITVRNADMYAPGPVIGTIQPGSAAEKAGIKVGDLIKKIDGKDVNNYAQVLHKLGSKYEGDAVSLELGRGKDTVALEKVVLGSAVAAFGQPYFGILPLRDDPAPGVGVRYVYPKGPADAAGIKAGDRIMKIGPAAAKTVLRPITGGRDQLISLLETARPGVDVRVEVKRKAGGATAVLTLKLAELPLDDSVPKKLPETASAKKALTKPGGKAPAKEAKKAETGFLERKPAADPKYWIYVPDTYDPNVACAVVVWLHPAGKNKEKDIEDFVSSWQTYCDEQNIILVCPTTDNPRGWTPGDSDYVQRAVRAVMDNYTVDRRRVVAHGMSVGGEMAFFLGFQARPLIRGVATVAASLGSNPRERVTNQPLAFFLAVGAKDPLLKGVTSAKDRLTRHKYPVVYREVANMGHEYIDGRTGTPTLEELIRWIDSLDRM